MGGTLGKVFGNAGTPTDVGAPGANVPLFPAGSNPAGASDVGNAGNSPWQKAARIGLGGAGGMLEQGQPQGQQTANPILQPGSGPSPVDPSYFAPTQFGRNNPIYGR